MIAYAPVITFDGPSGTGKGTIAQRIANSLNWRYLDSGILYRALAWRALEQGVLPDDERALKKLLSEVHVELVSQKPSDMPHVLCCGEDITAHLRLESVSGMASKIAAKQIVRDRLMELQRSQRTWPGLTTDGRDMGTVIFPDATVKFFLTASAEVRAQRRYKQLKDQGNDVSLRDIRAELIERDRRDASRNIAPMRAAPDAIVIDTSHLSIEEVMAKVESEIREFL